MGEMADMAEDYFLRLGCEWDEVLAQYGKAYGKAIKKTHKNQEGIMTDLLHDIQQNLNAPKNQFNKFGGYNYRSCEDILSAVKPLLTDRGTLTLSDEIVEIGGRVYVKATVRLYETIKDDEKIYFCNAYARESESQKGMNDPQCTGSASSYARKYALQGLFMIEDSAFDPDATNKHGKDDKKPVSITTEQVAILEQKIQDSKTDSSALLKKILSVYGVKDLDELTLDQYNEAVKRLDKANENN
jgi:hypothetical protein